MKIERRFTTSGTSPYDLVQYTHRSSVLRNPDGSTVFQMDDIEVPVRWSQVATDILAQKYFRKAGVPVVDESGNAVVDDKGNFLAEPPLEAEDVAAKLWQDKYAKNPVFANFFGQQEAGKYRADVEADFRSAALAKRAENLKVWRSERSSYSFSRAFTLPENVNPENICASMDKGVLKVCIPKKETEAKAEPKRIAVTGA